MARGDSFHEYIMKEVFAGIEGLSSRAMFGGFGIYKQSLRPFDKSSDLKHGVFFALISGGELFFKVDESNRADYEKYDSKPFIYTGHKGKYVTLSYWQLPEEIMENGDELIKWIDKSVEASIKSKKK
jgi:DNA transformation protein and related proteins